MNTPCQDAYGIASGAVAGLPYVAIALADGHGSEKHDLSEFGAALAAKAGLEEMQSLFFHYGIEGKSSLKHNFRDHFPRKVVSRWCRSVLEDAKDRLGEEGLSSGEGQNVYRRYGTTLLTALVTSDAVIVGRIGDGDILLVKRDGAVEAPFREDLTLLGSATHSMSSPDANRLWQTAWFQETSDSLLLLATDGLGNAISLDKFAGTLKDRIEKYGIEKVAAAIPKWLDDLSVGGSDDDITLALVFSRLSAPTESGDSQKCNEIGVQEKNDELEKRIADQGRDDGGESHRGEQIG
jgi:serine/threonine protein phosphatase PrpC